MTRGKKVADWNMSLGCASKLASVVVHAQEYLEEQERAKPDPDALAADRGALASAAYDREVREWIAALGPIAPLKRTDRDRAAKAARQSSSHPGGSQ